MKDMLRMDHLRKHILFVVTICCYRAIFWNKT